MTRKLARLVALIWLMAVPAQAQQLATLVADSVTVAPDGRLVASGQVEVLYEGTRLRARRITYDRGTGRLRIDGPITLTDGTGNIVVADQAALDADLQNGILQSARLVLDQQLQLAATQIARVGGRYTRLSNTVASSCNVCPGRPTPEWEIRARRVIHDQKEGQVYFDDATFRLAGVPVLYFPRLRIPDPANERATGFLLPRLRTTSRLGTGFKLPYFITLGDHADLTLTPYISGRTRTLQARYRQAFASGTLSFEGALSRDDISPDDGRYYLFGEAGFDLPAGFRLSFDIEKVSDPAYLLDYGYADQDRLETELRLTRARRKDLFRASLTEFETLRESELPIRDQLPDTFAVLSYDRRIRALGGEIRLGVDGYGLKRASDAPGAGRDVTRLGVDLAYTRGWTTARGIVGRGTLELAASSYVIGDSAAFATRTDRIVPSASLELRWPLQKTGAGGAHHLIEPVIHLAWSREDGDEVPNEDSVLVEFDEGNLFSLSRFPGSDAYERGARAALGLSYTRRDPAGWSLGLTMGRILRATPTDAFGPGTGLDGDRSDWLAAARLELGERVDLTTRTLFDEDLDITRNAARIAWRGARGSLATSYYYADATPTENRPETTHELQLDAAWRVSRHWTGKVDGRFDLVEDNAAEAGVGLQYRSECLTLDLSVSRRFTSSPNVNPSTDFGIQLSLAGIGSGERDSSYSRACAG